MSKFQPTIGLEIHAELGTKSKMFCGCKNNPHEAVPNTHVCPVCMAHPGSLPVPNKQAVKSVLLLGQAIEGTLADYSEFDRKNYFYPDIPKAYQISQYEFPFVKGGEICGIKVTRVHLEEDTARSLHDQGSGTVIDYNRAGVPLMELVTEPVIHDAKTASSFAKELQLLLRTLNISEANLERGEMRIEANISISDSKELGTLVEVKNLNSFRSVESAIEFEIKRQTQLLESGELVVRETRGWDENKSKTFSQRKKETADDYRYFPDPDITKQDRSLNPEFSNSRLDDVMPVLPEEKRLKYTDLGLTSNIIELIISNKIFDSTMQELSLNKDAKKLATLAANYLTSDVSKILNDTDESKNFSTTSFIDLIRHVEAEDLNSRVAKDLLPEIISTEVNVLELAKERGLIQNSDTDSLTAVIDSIIADNPSVVEEYKSGKEAAIQFLIGQGMKATKGSANPAMLSKMIKERIS